MRIHPIVAMLVLFGAGSLPAQQVTLPLWPNGNPEPSRITVPESDTTAAEHHTVAGKPIFRLTNVSKPTLTLYPAPPAKNTGSAALVFPGGGYSRLSMDLEGSEICEWLNGLGMTCVLVKYRVPETGKYPENVEDLEDAQQAMRMTRTHAAEWKIDPKRVGTVGFSAGAHLATVLGTHPDFVGKNLAAVGGLAGIDARPAFQMILYPGGTTVDGHMAPGLEPTAETPKTFLVQAENDTAAHVESSLIYYQALKNVGVEAEMHLYARGGHGFGLRATENPVASHWPALAELWLHTIGILPGAGKP